MNYVKYFNPGLPLSVYPVKRVDLNALLQFQKRLRLNEARRLMLTKNLDALTETFEVGYKSPSQFRREYSRLFGAPPL
ncbi:helix-turn-helix domain-containing protein [Desulfocicer niacini]